VIRMKWNSMIAASLLFATLAQAGEPGFYLAATGGMGDENPKSNGINFGNSQGVIHIDPDQVEINDGSFAWGVALGYRINDYLSGEVEYADFGNTDVHEHYTVPNPGPIPFPSEFDLDYSSRVTGPVLSIVGTLPVGRSFELLLRGGALFASREYTVNGQFGGQQQKFASTVWVAGAGAAWSFAERWGVRAEYQRTGALEETLVTGETRVTRISLSALYRF
jgi:opacity protein-like surface antigen